MKSTAQYLTEHLQKLGYSLTVQHYRYDKTANHSRITHDTTKFASRGGKTIADIWDANSNLVSTGNTICSPKDNFQKRLGWVKAVGRAIGNLV